MSTRSVDDEEPRSAARAPVPLDKPAASAGHFLFLVALIAGWGLLMRRFSNSANIYATMGPFALTVVLLVGVLYRRELQRWFAPTLRRVLGGLAVGAGMTLLTYPAYAALRAIVPELEARVAVLYSAARETSLAQALPWVLAIIVAEELLWRGALLALLARRMPPVWAMAISIASYAAAQLGTGSWIVVALALACGTLWTLQRHWTGSLLSPLIAHLIWTPTVILLHPVTSV
jgi:uncharacterized protein